MKQRNRQQGAALVVSLLILLVLTIMALATTNTSTVDTRIAYNMQVQREAESLAQQAIDLTLSDNLNFNGTALSAPTVETTIGGKTYRVDLAWPISCLGESSGTQCDYGEATSSIGLSFPCRAYNWDISARVFDTDTNVCTIIHQGVKVYVRPTDIVNCVPQPALTCPPPA